MKMLSPVPVNKTFLPKYQDITFLFLQNECATRIGVSPLLPCDNLISN